ncbi:hypothetical protein RN001_004079 [Aquatica leii]|uniref:Metallo-beta-lactamase domain-containing protein 1 n=1 Tax=Aquatica leii TaxID=1421715 RepID=A0AAN7QPF7_9COLE|nr:hypothetical protein RN001_004079 [Aquatica leii]
MTTTNTYEVIILFDGYSKETENATEANCTCTLINGPKKIIVDTMTAWDGPKLTKSLQDRKIDCDDIDYVICTHGHSDHIGCNYLFPKAIHIVGYCISHEHVYTNHDFNREYIIDESVKVISTPGHTLQDVSVIVQTDKGVIAIVGDLFENECDLKDDSIWKKAGSDSEVLQIQNRNKILQLADWIVPGHGSMFKVNKNV